MLDIKFIRNNPDIVKKGAEKKGIKVDIDDLLNLDRKKREYTTRVDNLRAEQNKLGKEDIEQAKKIKNEIKQLESELEREEKKFNDLLLQIPNLAFDDVPVGKDERDNVVLRKVGKIKKFNFPVKDYLEIAEKLDIIDVKRAAKIAGSRFGFLKREAALIEFALIRLALDNLVKEKFIPVIPPVMLKEEMARGTGYFEAADKEEAYFIPEDNLYLVGTSEQSLLAMHADEIFEERELPRRYVGFSTCFRREAGSYGKDTKGILRVHQFDKVEMVSFCKPEDSKKEHLFLLEMEERLMKSLEIPYRVVNICTGDLGMPAAAKYDIEAWLPSENRYRETHSTSNCTDFQARRLNIRCREKNGNLGFIHTLNGTVFSQRPILAIIENFQQKNGNVKAPKVLQKYLHFKEIKRAG
jgi:seryl-tRNA synthetase